jgi:glycerol-3-phosphate dehydrogenase (NAD(P)+)
MANITMIGGGSWGLAMSYMLDKKSHQVKVWEYNKDNVRILNETRRNEAFLKDITLPKSIMISSEMKDVLSDKTDVLVLAVPSAFFRTTVKNTLNHCKFDNLKAIVNLTKGIEEGSLKRMSEILYEEFPMQSHEFICTLSGPSHAEEVAKGIPTAVVVAGKNMDTLKYVQNEFSNDTFRVYTSIDVIGVEIGAAAKNVIAIAAGVIDGLGYGDNTKGALLTRGLVEIQRLGKALNAEESTFSGLSGLGDLVTTAISIHSRNRYVGYHLGKGMKLEEITKNMVMVAEGVSTTKNIYELKEKLNVSMPITDAMYQLIFNNKDPKEALKKLMIRELKDEKE